MMLPLNDLKNKRHSLEWLFKTYNFMILLIAKIKEETYAFDEYYIKDDLGKLMGCLVDSFEILEFDLLDIELITFDKI